MKPVEEKSFSDFYCFRMNAILRRLGRNYNSRLAELGITKGQAQVMFHLLEQNGSSVKDIAARLQLDSPAITSFVDHLVKGKLVERREDPENRRCLQILLTPRGNEVAVKALVMVREYTAHIEQCIGPKNLEAFEESIVSLETELR